jgi:hypothetical protein
MNPSLKLGYDKINEIIQKTEHDTGVYPRGCRFTGYLTGR